MIKLLLHKETEKSFASGFGKYRKENEIMYENRRFAQYIRVRLEINMGVQIRLLINDQKVFAVMSAQYRTCVVSHT